MSPKPPSTPDPDKRLRVLRAFTHFKGVWYCIAAFIALVSFCHFVSLLYAHLLSRSTKQRPQRNRRISLLRLPLALLNAYRSIAFRWTIHLGQSYTLNFAEVLLTAAYCGVIFTWALMKSTSLKGVRQDPRYWGNVAGNIAATQFPLIIALGMRNNIISLLTGVSFDKLNYLHRMSARVVCVLVWLHAAGRIKLGLAGNTSLAHPWVRSGILAATSLTVLCIVAIRPVRNRNYEFFLMAHGVLAFIVLVGAYFHAQGQKVGYLMLPTFLLWGLDRFLRLVRLIAFNYGYLAQEKRASGAWDATVDVISQRFLRVTINRPHYFHWRPGQSVYLSFPTIPTILFQSHPFTMSTADVGKRRAEGAINDESKGAAQYEENQQTLVFFVRVRDGMTRRLLESALKGQVTRAIVDGPYGSPPMLRGFENVILIAGGSGVAFTLPLFLDLVYRAKRGYTGCYRLVFIWVIRQADHFASISNALTSALEDIPESLTLDLQIYTTSSPSLAGGSIDETARNTIGSSTAPSRSESLPVSLQQGRPDLQAIIRQEVEQGVGSMSVNVCGSQELVKSVRAGVAPLRMMDILRGGPSVSFHVEW